MVEGKELIKKKLSCCETQKIRSYKWLLYLAVLKLFRACEFGDFYEP